MRRLAVIVVLASARVASAGECSIEAMADAQDARAKHPKPSDDDFHLCLWWDDFKEPKVARRLRASCETILTARPTDDLCIDIAAQLGLDQLAKTDVVAAIGARKLEITNPHAIDFLASTRSPRAAQIVIDAWKKNQAFVDTHPKVHDIADDWANWRGSACRALGATGDSTDFLTGVLAEAKLDRGVKRAAVAAIKAIEARAAKPK